MANEHDAPGGGPDQLQNRPANTDLSLFDLKS
jgi:hypothetical protein